MATQPVRLVYCAAGNPRLAACAVAAGWLYGARLPGHVSQPLYFADQDWKRPDRTAYIAALAKHCPAAATVLDWEREEQLPEVLSWAEEAAQNVTEAVIIVAKVPGGVPLLPRVIGGKRVVLGYSVPTSYGASPLGLWEFAGRPVHLLGGQPHKQLDVYRYLRGICDVVGADGNAACQQCHRGRFWSRERSPAVRSHWWQLREAGDNRTSDVNLECLRRSLIGIREAWQS